MQGYLHGKVLDHVDGIDNSFVAAIGGRCIWSALTGEVKMDVLFAKRASLILKRFSLCKANEPHWLHMRRPISKSSYISRPALPLSSSCSRSSAPQSLPSVFVAPAASPDRGLGSRAALRLISITRLEQTAIYLPVCEPRISVPHSCYTLAQSLTSTFMSIL